MRRYLPLLLLLSAVSLATGARGQGQAASSVSDRVLGSVQSIHAITNTQAAQALPVNLEATVTYVFPQDASMFVQDGGFGVFVVFAADQGLQPGDRVRVSGITEPSFRPQVKASEVRLLAHGKLPAPPPANFQDLIRSKFDSQYVLIQGRILSAALDQEEPERGMRLQIKVDQGLVIGHIAHPGKLDPANLLDAEVAVTGVAGGDFDSKMEMAGVWLDMNSAENLTLLHPPVADPWALPPSQMDDVIFAYRNSNNSQRVRITGTLTYFEPSALAVVQKDGTSILVKTDSTLALHAGQAVEATGFPSIAEDGVRLEGGQLRSSAQVSQVQPQVIDWEGASTGKYAYDLVSMEGEVVALVHDSRVDLMVLKADGHLFSATLRHNSSDAPDQAGNAEEPTIGSRVRVTGVCFVDAGNHWRDRLWFDLRMRSLKDVAVMQQPSWWTVKRMAYVVTAMSLVILAAVIWLGMLDRRLRQQNAVMARQSQEDAMRERRLARQEQQRSQILELISSSAALPDVLREIQAMVSSRLLGASCWFELHASGEGGSDAERPVGPAIVFQELFARDGSALGFLLATPRLQSSAETDVSAALLVGARLAELAIETRRLYSDLHHRSEYDLLTDIPNRFSMERKLDQLMQSARSNEAIFGLIYVDLDRFKQVNDRYGHHVGDLYLQEATRRMKLQLRNGDVLARIGGDEFIALVPILRSRADAEEIATRLERCFDEPFELAGYTLLASASIGLAVYPEDGATKEELQRSADAAMYAHKQSKKPDQELTLRGSAK